jgi:hypothetical protein
MHRYRPEDVGLGVAGLESAVGRPSKIHSLYSLVQNRAVAAAGSVDESPPPVPATTVGSAVVPL